MTRRTQFRLDQRKTKTNQVTVVHGDDVIEAIRHDDIWDINYPWGCERFIGSANEVRRLIETVVRNKKGKEP